MIRCSSSLAAFALATVLPVFAQTAPAPLQSELVTTGLYVIRGGGANTVVRFSSSGLVLVDAKAPGEFRPLMSQVHKLTKLSDAPVRALLLTSGAPAHAGNAAALEDAGARLVAQRDVAARLPAAGASAVAPRVVYDRDYAMRLGGADVKIEQVGDDASVVLFPDLRVAAIGALLPAAADEPAAQRAARRASLQRALALPFDRAVPGDGPVMSRADVESALAKLAPTQSVVSN